MQMYYSIFYQDAFDLKDKHSIHGILKFQFY